MLDKIVDNFGGALIAFAVIVALIGVVVLIAGTDGNKLAPYFQNVINSLAGKVTL